MYCKSPKQRCVCVYVHVQCKHCGKPFASHAAHDSHVRRTHAKTATSASFSCSICRRSFTHAYELEYHLSSHRGQYIMPLIVHNNRFKTEIAEITQNMAVAVGDLGAMYKFPY